MGAKRTQRIFGIVALLGIVASSPALGSHLDTPSLSPDSGQGQHSRESQNIASKTYAKPEVPASSTPPTKTRRPSEQTPTPQTAEQRTQRAKPHTKFAWRLILKSRYKAAVSAYREAIKKNPQSASSYVGLGIALTRLGNVDTAKKAFLKAINLNPRLSSALVHLGYLYAHGSFGQAEPQTALRLFRQASKLGDPFADIALLDMKSQTKL